MASPEMLGHLEGREQQRTALDTLSVADIQKRPENVASKLQQSQKANEVAERIVGTERANQIQQDNPRTKHPETLSKDPETAQIQGAIYESLGIDKNTDSNNALKKFSKGIIDGLIVGNAEIVMMIKNEGVGKFADAIKAQFSTLEGVGQVLKALGMSVWDLATGDAYDRGKSLAELGLITTGAGAAGSLAKYAGKTAIRTSVKVGSETATRSVVNQALYATGRTVEIVGTGLQVPAKVVKRVATETGKVVGVVGEKTGISPALRSVANVGNEVYERSGAKKVVEGTRQAIKSTLDTGVTALGATEAVQVVKGKIGEVVDKRMQARYEKLEAEGKLIPKERLDIDMYSEEQLKGLRERLRLGEHATTEEIEKAFQLKLYEAMEQYEKQGKKNLERIGMDIMEQMRQHGIEDPKKAVANEIQMVREAYERGEIKIVRVEFYHPDIPKEGFRSPYQLGEGTVKPPKYGAKRESIDKDLGLYGLDPKYATVLVNEKELSEMVSRYARDPKGKQVMVSVFDLASLQKRSGMTMYDTMLVGGVGKGKEYILDINDIFTVRALKNIEKGYNVKVPGIGDFQKLQNQALEGSIAIWERDMYRAMPNFMELQVIGRVGPPIEHYVDTEIKNVFSK